MGAIKRLLAVLAASLAFLGASEAVPVLELGADEAQAAVIFCPDDGSPGDGICFGTNLADTIHGTSGTNQIVARGGKDTVYGKDGNDFIWGEGDVDYLEGNNGIDEIAGGTSSDSIIPGVGNDKTWGEDGRDRIYSNGDPGYTDNNNCGEPNNVTSNEGDYAKVDNTWDTHYNCELVELVHNRIRRGDS
jgi:Ca2+-binding RTX toxin-like protein